MASRKRSKGSKGKKASPPSSRSSLKGDEAPDAMPGLKEAVEAPASEFTASTSAAKKSEKKGDKKDDKGGAGGDKPVVKPVAARAPPPRMVYFDPAKVLPSADKRTGEREARREGGGQGRGRRLQQLIICLYVILLSVVFKLSFSRSSFEYGCGGGREPFGCGPADALMQRVAFVRGGRWAAVVELSWLRVFATPFITAACFVLRLFWFTID